MLVLKRKVGQRICIGDDVTIEVVELGRESVRLGVVAPREVSIHREEVYDAILVEKHGRPASSDGG